MDSRQTIPDAGIYDLLRSTPRGTAHIVDCGLAKQKGCVLTHHFTGHQCGSLMYQSKLEQPRYAAMLMAMYFTSDSVGSR